MKSTNGSFHMYDSNRIARPHANILRQAAGLVCGVEMA
jgi:hypothetical protein